MIESTRVQRHEEKVCLSLITAYDSLFGGDGVLESLINVSLNTSLSLLLLRAISSYDLLGLCEVSPDGLRISELLDLYKTRVLRLTNLSREDIQGGSLNRVDCELVVRVNSSEASRNLIPKHQTN